VSPRGRNPWVEAHDRWYARASVAERAEFDASRSAPKSKVFTAKQFPSRLAWARFLLLESVVGGEHTMPGEALPERYAVSGQSRVYAALRSQELAIAGFGRCGACGECVEQVERYQFLGGAGEGCAVLTERFVCPKCARWMTVDPMYGIDTALPAPL
jgi:hypothetical protein